jgi:hypothetical protein
MAQRVTIGEFQPFTENVEAAEVTGPSVKRATDILGTRPPFRDAEEGAALSFEDNMAARRLAIDASGVMAVALEAGDIDRTINTVVFSRTGALALRADNRQDIHDEALELVSALDGFNDIAPVLAHTVHVG